MKNKKAGIRLLGGHIINILISVLVLIVLIIFSVKVSGLFFGKSDLEKAENNLNNFVIDFENFMNGGGNEKEFIILGPEDWYILFYERWSDRSQKCEEYDYCVCFCEDNEVKDCEKQGVCLELNDRWEWESNYKVNEIPYTIKVKKNE